MSGPNTFKNHVSDKAMLAVSCVAASFALTFSKLLNFGKLMYVQGRPHFEALSDIFRLHLHFTLRFACFAQSLQCVHQNHWKGKVDTST